MKQHAFSKLLVVAFLAAMPCAAANVPDNYRTGNMFNGRWWSAMGEDGKILFLTGYTEHFLVSNCDDKTFPQKATFTEMASGLNRIYAAPENARIPIAFVLRVFQMKVSGAKETDIVERLRTLREAFALSDAAAPAK